MPKIALDRLTADSDTLYPPPLDAEVAGRSIVRAGRAGGLTQFGVNFVTLAPGAKSSMRHWHEEEDEFVLVLDGTLTMVTDAGETPMAPGDCAAFPAGDPDAHHFINATKVPARFLVVGSCADREVGHYPDRQLKVVIEDGKGTFLHEDGRPFEAGT